ICSRTLNENELQVIRKAFYLSLSVHKDMRRISGEPYIYHSLEVARIVIEEMNLGGVSVVCALLHDVTKYTDISADRIRSEFGPVTGDIINGLARIEGLYTQKVTLHADNFIRLLLNLANDVRIILVKLADRLHNMRTLAVLAPEKQKKVAIETSHLYAPIAHRLGLYNIKTELDELSMKYSEPEIYHSIEKKLVETEADRTKYINRFIAPIRKELDNHGFRYDIKGRSKSVHSIWRKMKQQQVEFNEVYDLFAIRLILDSSPEDEKEDCWKVYSLITNLYQPNPKRLRDWISAPKNSGYESLHTTVIGPEGRWVEVQIRTLRMDEVAEKGHAAHWKYKKTAGEEETGEWLAKIREILENPQPETHRLDEAKGELYSESIFVFTPQGDLKKLSSGATVLDFAYAVHTRVGDTCTGAKVNDRIVPLKHKLTNGDQVEILTSKNQKPKQDWLKWVSGPRSKSKIKRALKDIKFREAESGKDLLKKKLRQLKIGFNDENIQKLVRHFRLSDPVELYQYFATEKIDSGFLKDLLVSPVMEENLASVLRPEIDRLQKSKTWTGSGSLLVIDDNPGLTDYCLARCCSPGPGAGIFGFVTVKKGITIHRKDCPNAVQMRGKYPYRMIKAEWATEKQASDFLTSIRIIGKDEVGMLNTISSVISNDMKVNMRSLNVRSEGRNFMGEIELLIHDDAYLDVLIRKLQKIKGVQKVVRTG
ncbi:MAG: RelA/SpoT family protein, partial [Bacteroidetes bacterium]|nr:RelA/SpoT family protein [Bacteroidota bacterium]